MKNLEDAVESFVQRIHRHLPLAEPTPAPSPGVGTTPVGEAESAPSPTEPRLRQHEPARLQRRARRLDRYAAVLEWSIAERSPPA